MKILQVSNFFKPMWESGGVARVAYEISKHLKDRGHEITVYTTNRSAYRKNIETNKLTSLEGMKVYYFENLRKYFPWITLPVVPYYLPFVARKQIKKFDIIHIHEHRSLLAVIVHHYAKKHGIPYVLQAHGSVMPFFAKQRFKRLFDSIWGCNILKDAVKVIALNTTEVAQYKKMGVDGTKIEIVPNGFNLSEYKKLPEKGEFRKKHSISNNEKIILYVGRLHKSKGIGLLVKAFVYAKNEIDNVRLVLIGPDNEYKSELKELARTLKVDDKIMFAGFVTIDEKMKAFVDADVFVTPRFSGFPVTFLEACACGTPIITTNKGDELDWIDSNVGYVVEYNEELLGDAIVKILNDKKLKKKFGEMGGNLVREKFNWDKIVKRLERSYETVLDSFIYGGYN